MLSIHEQNEKDVSILVLVDVFPELSPGGHTFTGTQSFNPCFSGCLSRIGRHSSDGERK